MSDKPTIQIDCSKVASERDFWSAYESAVGLVGSNEFGRNLDALWDAVESDCPGPGYPGEVDLRFLNCARLSDLRDGAFLTALKEIAGDASKRSIEVLD